jgi:hypothetical protein
VYSPFQGTPSPAMVDTLFNMVATTASFGSVLLCLVVAKHFTT